MKDGDTKRVVFLTFPSGMPSACSRSVFIGEEQRNSSQLQLSTMALRSWEEARNAQRLRACIILPATPHRFFAPSDSGQLNTVWQMSWQLYASCHRVLLAPPSRARVTWRPQSACSIWNYYIELVLDQETRLHGVCMYQNRRTLCLSISRAFACDHQETCSGPWPLLYTCFNFLNI